jgi:hypothetical protein
MRDVDMPLPLDPELAELSKGTWTLEKVERELALQKSSFEEIHQKLTSNAELLDHTPTIRPVVPSVRRQ